MKEIKLKPCAHCGHTARIMSYLGKFYVQCRVRDCHIRTEPYDTEEQAAQIWNRRVEE